MVNCAQGLVTAQGVKCLMDTPNLLADPNALLKSPVDRLEAAAQVLAQATVEFMLRGC